MTVSSESDWFVDVSFLPETIDPESRMSRPEIFASCLEDYRDFDFDPFVVPSEWAERESR